MPRGGEAFEWTYHFFWGLEDIIASFVNMWSGADTNKKVGLLLPRNRGGIVGRRIAGSTTCPTGFCHLSLVSVDIGRPGTAVRRN